jgi:alkylation response protein AidB-like acyl-CoA dehydrogenase
MSSTASLDHTLLAAAKRLAPEVVALRTKIEEARQIPAPLAEAIAGARLSYMYLPRSVGGPEAAPLEAFAVIEELSKADGSVGWCAMISSEIAQFVGWLESTVAGEIGNRPVSFAGSLRPMGRATPVDRGYRVTGQWNFASGIDNAQWLYAPCVLMDGDAPRMTPAGTPAVRAMWLPVSAATIKDPWSVMGLRGTGSQDFVIDDVFVPQSFTCFLGDRPHQSGPLYQPRMIFSFLFALNAAHALGIARGTMEEFVAMAARDASMQSSTVLRERPLVQAQVGEAEAILNAARAYVVDAVGRAWMAACENKLDPAPEIAQARLAITHSVHEAGRVVTRLFHAAGTNAIHTRNPLERHFRDIHVAEQHNAAFRSYYESAGKVLLGLRPSDPGW